MQINLSMKQKQTVRHREQTYGGQGGGVWGRDGLGLWDQQKQTTIYRMGQQGPLYSTGNHNDKEYEIEYTHIFVCVYN